MDQLTHYTAYLIYKDTINSTDIDFVRNQINIIFEIYRVQEKRTEQEIQKGEFKSVTVKGIIIDWNTFYHDQNDKINDLYFNLLSHYHNLQFDKFGWVAI